MTTYIIPIVSILGGAILLDEVITVRTLLGMALIIIGILAVNDVIRFKKKAEEMP
jgi:drug/metabolite transporter (DMT)-like permease